MVKFAKDGSDTLDAAVRLARAHTGRTMVAICGDHPFFSTSDWFIGTTDMPGGIPQWVRDQVVKFHYNDIASVRELFEKHPGKISCRHPGSRAPRRARQQLPAGSAEGLPR